MARDDREYAAQQFVGFTFQKFVFKTKLFPEKASKHSKIMFDNGRKKSQLHAAPPSPHGVQAKSKLVLAKVTPSKISEQSLS